ncbi:MAG TPA: hypothetical protein VHX11_08590 [Acidobacteriaceae bacterium]|jgi:pimeloyl-ACP methyl ester carboxylesterase|nr:hypothetical protein [Acidobacteriaceae bacterium]
MKKIPGVVSKTSETELSTLDRRAFVKGFATVSAGLAASPFLKSPAEAQAAPPSSDYPMGRPPSAFRPADHPNPPELPGSSRAGQYFRILYKPSTAPDELQLGVNYTFWMPDNVQTVRGVIVHQHGAGVEAAQAGASAAFDLHWQALAKKWDCVLLGPSYLVTNDSTSGTGAPGGASLWVAPQRGSAKAFERGLHDVAQQSGHAEIATAPWFLWGHSAGGSWSRAMSLLYPERIAAIFLRSGGGSVRAQTQVPRTVYAIPTMANAGILEMGNSPWQGTLAGFQQFRAEGAPIGFAADPRTAHFCGDSRYLAIPFFEACMEMRLPEKGSKSQTLRPVDQTHAWLASYPGNTAAPAAEFKGDVKQSVWLPNAAVAKAWMDYVKTGTVADCSIPPGPFNVRVNNTGDRGTEVSWDAAADIASGLGGFIVVRDGQGIARFPVDAPEEVYGRPLFQGLSFHDTPDVPLPKMTYLDATTKAGESHTYTVIALSSAGVPSVPGGSPDGMRTLTGRLMRSLPQFDGASFDGASEEKA